MGASAWPFPKEHYHQKVILIKIQDLLNPQHLNHDPCSLKENLSQLEHKCLCPSGIRMSGREPAGVCYWSCLLLVPAVFMLTREEGLLLEGEGTCRDFFPWLEATASRSGVAGLGSHCRIKRGCPAQASSVIRCLPESLLKWGTHIPPLLPRLGTATWCHRTPPAPRAAGSAGEDQHLLLPLPALRRETRLLRLVLGAARASRCPWTCSSGFDVLAVHDMETASEPSMMGFALWTRHSPGKHLHGMMEIF